MAERCEIECPQCGGYGWVPDIGCCGDQSGHGCCGNGVPINRDCDACGGCGTLGSIELPTGEYEKGETDG